MMKAPPGFDRVAEVNLILNPFPQPGGEFTIPVNFHEPQMPFGETGTFEIIAPDGRRIWRFRGRVHRSRVVRPWRQFFRKQIEYTIEVLRMIDRPEKSEPKP